MPVECLLGRVFRHGLSNEMMRSHPAKLQREVVEVRTFEPLGALARWWPPRIICPLRPVRSHGRACSARPPQFCIEKLPQGQGPGAAGTVELYHMTSDMIIRTASRCLLGDEVREQVHTEFAKVSCERAAVLLQATTRRSGTQARPNPHTGHMMNSRALLMHARTLRVAHSRAPTLPVQSHCRCRKGF